MSGRASALPCSTGRGASSALFVSAGLYGVHMDLHAGLIPGFALAILLSSHPLAAQTAADEKLVCKTDAKTGTRFKTKICKTRLQWEQMREQHLRNAREVIDRPEIETRRGD